MNYISNIIEPKQLWLMWQDNTPERNRHKVGVLTPETFEYVQGDGLESAKNAGFSGYPAFPMDKDIKQFSNPLPTFISRCPPKDRRDYNLYLQAFGLDANSADVQNMSDFALLGYTGAFLHGNPFVLVNDYADCQHEFDFILHVSRCKDNYFFKYDYDESAKERLIGKTISFVPDEHPKDPKAVKVFLDGDGLGYVQTGLTHSFRKWIKENRISQAKITKLNGDAENPNIYAYIKVTKV